MQLTFVKQSVKSFEITIDYSTGLLVLDVKYIVNANVTEIVRQIENIEKTA